MNRKVLFIDTVHPLIKNRLESHGFHCDWLPGLSYDHYLGIIPEYNGIIIRSGITLDSHILEKAVSLKFIGRLGSGLENIDVEYATSKGIKCLNSPEGNRDAVGEHTIGMLLALMNRLLIADSEVRRGIWRREENRGTEIKGKTIAIIGYGNMGSAFAQRLKGFGCRIIAYDKYKTEFINDHVEEVDMEMVYDEADIVSFHVPLNIETHYLACKEYFNRFKKPFILINTSRGGVVNTNDLSEAIKQDKITGAALDVIEYEESSFEMLKAELLPEPFQYLVRSQRVILSPHIAGWTHESKIRLAEVLVDKILEMLNKGE